MDNEAAKGLLNLIALGNQSAFAELYQGMSRMVYAYVLNQLNNAAEAEEVMADTLYDVWKSAAKFKGDSQVKTWVLGIARNKMLMKFRGRGERHEDVDDFAELIASDEPDAFAQMAGAQRQAGVQNCLGKLADEHRECLHLMFFEGYTLTEIGHIQKVPEGTVKSRLHHARQKIKLCLANLLKAEGHTTISPGAFA
ncbi:MAG: hypothetical protein RLZZ502_1450 [Pseudomonadota bacterium]|jgi:RNA polymerase sigma-70 factor (ECF subfamily)